MPLKSLSKMLFVTGIALVVIGIIVSYAFNRTFPAIGLNPIALESPLAWAFICGVALLVYSVIYALPYRYSKVLTGILMVTVNLGLLWILWWLFSAFNRPTPLFHDLAEIMKKGLMPPWVLINVIGIYHLTFNKKLAMLIPILLIFLILGSLSILGMLDAFIAAG